MLGVVVRADHGFGRAETELMSDIAGWRPDWLVEVARVVTELGTWIVGAVIAVVAAIACWPRLGVRALTPLLALAVTGPLNALAKVIVERPRPEEVVRAVTELGSGYPSGHSANAAALWIAVALVLPASHRRLWLTAGALIAIAVGVTRVLLGVHSPTDVLGGWALGLACVLTVWWVLDRLHRPQRGVR